ncbi:MAG: hypothetical protein IKA13_04525 [Bacteroidales bacterium]|nr:hypothetical protein [Bacteroidales bacterium]
MIKKLIPIILTLTATLCMLPMRGDTPPENEKEIPIKHVLTRPPVRSLEIQALQAYYNRMLNSVQTITTSNLGIVEMTVICLSTGEIWSETFDSAVSPHCLEISCEPGVYQITYLTSFGDLYEGTFTIW